MKTKFVLLAGFITTCSWTWGAPRLTNIRAELSTLRDIGGAHTGWGGSIPAPFYLLYSYCVYNGDEETYRDFMKDENPIIATMGAICLLDRFPDTRDDVLARMKSDSREVVLARGDMASPITLKELFERIEKKPDFIAAPLFPRRRPNQPAEPTR